MDQYLLNDDVYLYDFANRESKAGNGPFQCRMFDSKPCCIPNEIWTEFDKNKDPQRPPQVMAVINAYNKENGKNRGKIPCRHHYGMQHEYDGVLEAQCWHDNDDNVECEGKFNLSNHPSLTFCFQRNSKIGVCMIKMEPHAAPKNWIFSMNGWMQVLLTNHHSSITSNCLTNILTTGVSSKRKNGRLKYLHYTMSTELIMNMRNYTILKQDGILNAQHIIQCPQLLSS